MATTLTTRETAGTGATVKGSPLTNAEIDGNFLSLADNKLEASNNLSDLTDTTAAKANLELSGMAAQDSDDVDITGGSITGIVDLEIADGGTGASSAPAARSNLGLGSIAVLDTGTAAGELRLNSQNESFFVTINSNQVITGVKEFTEYTDFSGTSAIKVPVGNNIERPVTPLRGQVRFNTVTGAFEGNYDGTLSGWGALGGPGSGTTTFVDTFPIGAIAMWSGSAGDIPEGWQLCDGTNGSPDMRDRFIVGAGSLYSIGDTGGSKDAVVVEHTHTGNTSNAGSHSHGGNTSNNGNHTHGRVPGRFGDTDRGSFSSNYSVDSDGRTDNAGRHSHNISTNNTGSHTHSVSVSSTGVSGVDKNLPPYYAVAYIIKLEETIGQLIPENLADTIDNIENTLGTVVQDIGAMTGSVQFFAMQTVPNGWLKADGSAVSRTQYANLFAALGTIYGTGDGSTTFNLPDLRGEFVRGWDDGRGVDSGRAFGSNQADEFASHNHNTSNAGNHSHNITNYADGPISANLGHLPYDNRFTDTQSTSNAGGHTHSISSTGGSETRPRNVALLPCIKT